LEHPGRLVTREELKRKLWPEDTFVDFDQGLNKAVNRLREALGDSAENPRFIETLPRKGYRFICPLATPVGPSTEHKIAEVSPSTEGTAHKFRQRAAWIGGTFLILATAGQLMWRTVWRDHTLGAIRSIAVLPLEDLSGDATQEYFADGLTDELITDLGQIGSLRVISRTSVKRYKGARKPLPEIARELDVDAVVEGTVLRSGDQVRITAQLIQARLDKQLWADTYQGEVRDVLGLQNQVASAIARQIRVKLSPAQQAALENARAINPEAYEAYLRGVARGGPWTGFTRRLRISNEHWRGNRTTLRLMWDWPMRTCSWGTWSRCLLRKPSQGLRAKRRRHCSSMILRQKLTNCWGL
jgi:TolB-like protein